MLCACYESATDPPPPTHDGRTRCEWLRARPNASFARERQRWLVLQTPAGAVATLSYFADAAAAGRDEPLASLPAHLLELVGDVGHRLDVLLRGTPAPTGEREGAIPSAELVLTLRFDSLEHKLGWWRALRRAQLASRFVAGSAPCASPCNRAQTPRGSLKNPLRRRSRSPPVSPAESVAACEARRGTAQDSEELPESASAARARAIACEPGDHRDVVMESNGVCVLEDEEGSIVIEPRAIFAAKLAYSRLLKVFIRPPRAEYDMDALGPPKFTFCGMRFERLDRAVESRGGRLISYSVWRKLERNVAETGSLPRTGTVLYSHGNASSRIEGISQLALALHMGLQFIALDCGGSGHSGGEYVTLGRKESDDVMAVLDCERGQPGGTGPVALWGRSMGAVTALLVACTRDPEVVAVVADSAYSSLRELSFDVVKRGAPNVPRFLASLALGWIRDSIAKRADFDLFDVDALRHAPECGAAAFLMCAADDTFVEPKHSAALLSAMVGASRAELCVTPGAHNTTRPADAYTRIEQFLRDTLRLEDDEAAQPRLSLAAQLEVELEPLVVASRRAAPNFAALPPWTIETLRARARQKQPRVPFPTFPDAPPLPPGEGLDARERWIEQTRTRHDKVDAMQEETTSAAKLFTGLLR